MNEIIRWPESRQRQGLAAVIDQGISFLKTDEGKAFLDQLQDVIGPVLVGRARRVSVQYSKQEARSLIVHHLFWARREKFDVATRSALAENPWAYLTTCALRWLHEDELGHRGADLEAIGDAPGLDLVEEQIFPSHGLTSLDIVITKTWEQLVWRTPNHLSDPLRRLVEWLAWNPAQRRSYVAAEIRAALLTVPEFTPEQIRDVANVCWGGRPESHTTSIMGGLLKDPSFDPIHSDSHLRALRTYQARIRAHSALPSEEGTTS